MPPLPLKPDEQASSASKPSLPEELALSAERPLGARAATVPPEEPKKAPQADAAAPPVTPPLPTQTPPPPAVGPPRIDQLTDTGPAGNRAEAGRSLVSFLTSALVHAALMILLAMLVAVSQTDNPWGNSLTLSASVDEPLETEPIISDSVQFNTKRREDAQLSTPPAPVPDVNPISELPPNEESPMQMGDVNIWSNDWAERVYEPTGGGLEGRSSRPGRSGDGASDESEEAVERGLWWLVAHQRKDGAWSFDHREGNCRCRNPGDNSSTTGATAIALAPFLGAGYTHQDGKHKETVRRGLYYLQKQAFETPNGIDLREGTMYAQGLATIVLCEAYAMTKDEALKSVAQGALDFIEYAQGENGGWRYNPGEPGDTTVTGWQLMALKSGEMAGLRVKSPTMYMVNDFLDTVQSEAGAMYGYQDPRPRPATTAVGLLCRMYLRWPRSHPGLVGGVRYLDETGPSPNDMYFNYYATQVMHHWQGSEWKRWNDRMHDALVQSQASQGHENGSWYFEHPHSEKGGRLYNTAMAIMTLEVYYRYMPLYRDSWSE